MNADRPGRRLLLLSQYFHPEVGATQTRVREFAKHLAAEGHDVTVVCEFPNHPHGRIPESYRGTWFEEDSLDGFRVLRVPVYTSENKTFATRLLFYGSFLVSAVALGLLRLRGRFDAVFATSPPLTVGVAGWILARAKRARFVLDVRDLWPEAAQSLGELSNPRLIAAAASVANFLYRHADATTTVTHGFHRHIAARSDGRPVHLVTNGTVPEIFDPARVDPSIRERLGLGDRFVCTFAGTMGIAQGLPFLLDVADALRDDPDVVFLFVGSGPVRAELERAAAERELPNVVFHEQVPLAEITPYLTASDALMVPLRDDPVFHEFVPSKLFDSLACGRPVILGVDGEARELLEESGGGLFAQPENVTAWVSAIRGLRDEPDAAARMGRRGAAWVLRDHTREAQARKLSAVLAPPRRPEVLVYGPLPAPYGGARVSFGLFYEYLRDNSQAAVHHVDVPVRTQPDRNPPGPVDRRATLREIVRSLPRLRSAERVVLFCSPGSMCSWGLLVALVAKALGVPASLRFFSGHPLAPMDDAGRARRWITRRLLRATERLVVETDAGAREMEVFTGRGTTKVAGYRPRSVAEGESGRPSAPVRFVFVGRAEPVKGIDVLLQAWERVRSARPAAQAWTLEIFGSCEDEWRTRIESCAGVVYRGVVDASEIPAALENARALVLPTRYSEEGHSGAIIEALLAGTPVITSTLPGPAELIRSGTNGMLVDPYDPEALAGAIERLATSDREYRALRSGAERTSREFDAAYALPRLAAALGLGETPEHAP